LLFRKRSSFKGKRITVTCAAQLESMNNDECGINANIYKFNLVPKNSIRLHSSLFGNIQYTVRYSIYFGFITVGKKIDA